MGNILKIIINVFLLSTLTYAQAYMDIDTNGVTVDYDLSDVDSITFNTVGDTMNVDITGGSDIYYLAEVDSITFTGDTLGKTMKVDTSSGTVDYKLSDISSITYVLLYYDSTGTVTDIDGNIYEIVKIGEQWWMAENLKVTHYRNGEAIPNVTDNTEWSNLSTGAYCNYDNNSSNVATYGRLYNWYAAVDNREIAPTGWHVPSDAEWQTLVDYLGGSAVAGGKMKESGTAHWNSPNTSTNESGFSALPGGYRCHYGLFGYDGYQAHYWSATQYMSFSAAWYRYLYYNCSDVCRYFDDQHDGFSVRCVRD